MGHQMQKKKKMDCESHKRQWISSLFVLGEKNPFFKKQKPEKCRFTEENASAGGEGSVGFIK